MKKSDLYETLQKIVEEGYGWDAIQGLISIMHQKWDKTMIEASEVRWQNNIVRKFASSDLTNKRKVDAINDVLGGDGEE